MRRLFHRNRAIASLRRSRWPMTLAVSLPAVLGLAACDRQSGASDAVHPANAAAADVEPGKRVATNKTISVMRPAVVDEVAPAAPPPAPEPFEATVHFPYGGTRLSDGAEEMLAQVLDAANRVPDSAITLRGHTDSKGNDVDNKRVSKDRAEAVRDWLADHGVDKDRMTVIALGEARPVAPNATLAGDVDEAGRSQNRRVDIVVEAPAIEASPSNSGEPATED